MERNNIIILLFVTIVTIIICYITFINGISLTNTASLTAYNISDTTFSERLRNVLIVLGIGGIAFYKIKN